MDYTDKTITLESGKSFIVIEQVNFENETYLYLVNREDEEDTKFVKVENDSVTSIDSDLFKNNILPLFIEKLTK